MAQVGMSLPPKVVDEIKELAKQNDVSASKFMRDLVLSGLEVKRKEVLKQKGVK